MIHNVENRDPASIKDVVEHYGMSSEKELAKLSNQELKRLSAPRTYNFVKGFFSKTSCLCPGDSTLDFRASEKEATEKFKRTPKCRIFRIRSQRKLQAAFIRELALDAARLQLIQTVMIHILQDQLEFSITEEDLSRQSS